MAVIDGLGSLRLCNHTLTNHMALLEEWIAVEEMYSVGEENPAIEIPESVYKHSQTNPLDNADEQEDTYSITSMSHHGNKEIVDNFEEDERNSIPKRTSTSITDSWNFYVSQRTNSEPEPKETDIDVGTEFIEDIDRQELQSPIDYFMDLILDSSNDETISRPRNGSNLPETVNSNIHTSQHKNEVYSINARNKAHNPDLSTEKTDFHFTANTENVNHDNTEQPQKEELIRKIGKLHTTTQSECSTVGSTSADNLRYGFFNNEQSRKTSLSLPRIFTNMEAVDYSNLQIPFPIYPQTDQVILKNQDWSTFKTQIPGVNDGADTVNDVYNSTSTGIACIPAVKYSENERNHITMSNQCFSNFDLFVQFYEFCEFVSWYLKIQHQSADSHCQVFSSINQPSFQSFLNVQPNQNRTQTHPHASNAKFICKSNQHNCEKSSDQHLTHKIPHTTEVTTESNQKNQLQSQSAKTLQSTAASTTNFNPILNGKVRKKSKIKKEGYIHASVNNLVKGASIGKKRYWHEKNIPKVSVENQKVEHTKPSDLAETLTRKRKSTHFKNTRRNKKFIDEYKVEEHEEIRVDNVPRKINFSMREFDYHQTPKRKSNFFRNKLTIDEDEN